MVIGDSAFLEMVQKNQQFAERLNSKIPIEYFNLSISAHAAYHSSYDYYPRISTVHVGYFVQDLCLHIENMPTVPHNNVITLSTM